MELGCGLGVGLGRVGGRIRVGVRVGVRVLGFGLGLAADVSKHLTPRENPHVVGAEGGGATDGTSEEGDTE